MPQKTKQKSGFSFNMTEKQFKEKIETIKHRYAIMYAFAQSHEGFKELDLITPEEYAEDLIVMRDFALSR
jgi:hypothetical protein